MCYDNLRGFCRVQWLYEHVAFGDADGCSKRYGCRKRYRNGSSQRFGNADCSA